RAVAAHAEIWRSHIGQSLPEGAVKLLNLIDKMAQGIQLLTASLGKIPLVEVQAKVREIDAWETEADKIRLDAETLLAKQPVDSGADAVRLTALIDLYDLLEKVTDTANHCAADFIPIADRRR